MTLVERRDSGRMPNSGRKTWFQSYVQLWSEDTTPIICSTLVGGRDSGHMPDSSWKIWLRSYILTLDALPDSGRHHNSSHASRLRSMSVPHVLPPQLWKTSHGQARWLHHLIAWTLSRKQTGRDAWLVQRSKPQQLTTSQVQVSDHVLRDQQTLSLAWSKRNPSI
jgi:hypothetical protein